MEKWIEIGQVMRPHGLNGQFKVNTVAEYQAFLPDLKAFFLEINGKKVPFFPESVRIGNEVLVKFEDVDNREEMMEFKGAILFARASDLEAIGGLNLSLENPYKEFVGGQLKDEELGAIGTIVDILEMPQQWMALVDYKEKEIMIPLHESLIISKDKNSKEILCNLPEGLLELE